jgi:glycerol-3-phosphate dehydrogenase
MSGSIVETQVAVIGGGITGAAIIRELSKYKIDACLLEKEGGFGFGVTKVCQGLLHGGISHLTSRTVKYHQDMPFKEYLLQPFLLKENLQNLGREEYFSLAHTFNEEIERPGRLVLAEDKEDMEMIELIKDASEDLGMRGISLLDRKGIEEMEPRVNPKFIGGLFDANEAVVLPTAWAIAFAENAELNGAHVYKDTEVLDIDEKKDYYLITTPNGMFKAEYVINAAGLYADDVAKMVDAADFEITGWKAQQLVMENRDYTSRVLCGTPKPQQGRLVIPTTHNSLIVAHTFHPMTHKGDKSTTKEGVTELLGWLHDFVSSISDNHLISAFSGFLTFNTKNPNDHLLESPKRGFITAAVSAPGLGPAPALAREIVRMLADQGLVCTTRSDFNPYRHKAPRIIDLPVWEKNERIRDEPRYGHMVCRCEKVSEQEIREAVRGGARTLDEIKYKTLAGFGRCQGGFCTSRVIKIMAQELKVSPLEITKNGRGSYILTGETKSFPERGPKEVGS